MKTREFFYEDTDKGDGGLNALFERHPDLKLEVINQAGCSSHGIFVIVFKSKELNMTPDEARCLLESLTCIADHVKINEVKQLLKEMIKGFPPPTNTEEGPLH